MYHYYLPHHILMGICLYLVFLYVRKCMVFHEENFQVGDILNLYIIELKRLSNFSDSLISETGNYIYIFKLYFHMNVVEFCVLRSHFISFTMNCLLIFFAHCFTVLLFLCSIYLGNDPFVIYHAYGSY